MAFSDMQVDLHAERYGLTNRIKHGARELGNNLGGHAVMDLIENSSTNMGMRFNNMMDKYDNAFLPDRIYVSENTANMAVDDEAFIKKYNERRSGNRLAMNRTRNSGVGFGGKGITDKNIENIGAYAQKGTDAGDYLDKFLDDDTDGLSGSISKMRVRNMMLAMAEGVEVSSDEDMNKFMKTRRNKMTDDAKINAYMQEAKRQGRITQEQYRKFAPDGAKQENDIMSNKDMVSSIDSMFYGKDAGKSFTDKVFSLETGHAAVSGLAMGGIVGSMYSAGASIGLREMFSSANELTDQQKLDMMSDPNTQAFIKLAEEARMAQVSGADPVKMKDIKSRLANVYSKMSGTDEGKKIADVILSKNGISMSDGVVDTRGAKKEQAFGGADKLIDSIKHAQATKARDKFIAGGLNKIGMGEYVDADGGLIGGMSRDSMADKFNSMMSSGFKDVQDEDTRSELIRRTAGQKKMTTEQVEQLMAKFGQFQGTAYSGDISNELLGGKSAQEMLNYLEMNNKVLSEIADRLKVQK